MEKSVSWILPSSVWMKKFPLLLSLHIDYSSLCWIEPTPFPFQLSLTQEKIQDLRDRKFFDWWQNKRKLELKRLVSLCVKMTTAGGSIGVNRFISSSSCFSREIKSISTLAMATTGGSLYVQSFPSSSPYFSRESKSTCPLPMVLLAIPLSTHIYKQTHTLKNFLVENVSGYLCLVLEKMWEKKTHFYCLGPN